MPVDEDAQCTEITVSIPVQLIDKLDSERLSHHGAVDRGTFYEMMLQKALSHCMAERGQADQIRQSGEGAAARRSRGAGVGQIKSRNGVQQMMQGLMGNNPHGGG